MFVAERSIELGGRQICKSPLIVPSFSSKGFPNIRAMMGTLSEYITESSLVSLYDIHYGNINKKNNFADLLFIDSGGYEASVDSDLSDAKKFSGKPNSWPHKVYLSALKKLRFPPETAHVIVNYDNPRSRLTYRKQVNRALSDFSSLSGREFISEIVFKPEKGRQVLDVSKIIGQLDRIVDIDIVGFTEKELGVSTLDRMYSVCKLRNAMSDENIQKPIHVFGALDPISVPLYFISGADIFDGLTWLRYALHEGKAVYMQNYLNLTYALDSRESMLNTKTWVDNVTTINKLQRQMRTFVSTRDFGTFEFHGGFFQEATNHLKSLMEGK